MDEHEIHFSKARERCGLPAWAVMRLEARDDTGDFWKGVSQHETEEEADSALAALRANGGA